MKRRIVIWGTGNICSKIMNLGLLNPQYFIDNDLSKSGNILYGLEILHPTQIAEWENIFIILSLDNYLPVKRQLINIGLKEKEDFIWYREWLFGQDAGKLVEEARQFMENEIKLYEKAEGCKIIFSDFLSFDKGVCEYVNRLNKIEKNLVLFSEAGWISDLEKNKLNIPVIKLPRILSRNQYIKKADNQNLFDLKEVEDIKNNEVCREAALNLRMGYPDMAEGYEYIVCYFAYKTVHEIIRYWKPEQVILWNAFYAIHLIIRSICREMNIPVRYMEFGNIPGTIILEETGQMGESYPARAPEEFLDIPVSTEEYINAGQSVRYLRQSRLNRNVQPHNNLLQEVKKKLKHGRSVIFYAGQNDNASGMQPYTENTRRFHSPIFKTSDEAALFLAEVCRKNDWNYIYKPHPMMAEHCKEDEMPENVISVNNVDINDLIDMADVVVTILSTVSYIALIREKPVVMLGYTQLKGKGCTYEAFEKCEIEEQLINAIKNKNNIEFRHNFVKHVVQLEKYYFHECRIK